MIRSELVERLSEQHKGLLVSDIDRIVTSFFDSISAAMVANERIEIRGFGAFTTRARVERIGRNPRTGSEVVVAAKRVPHFRCSKTLSERLNGTG